MDTNFGMGCLFSGPGRGDCAHFVRIPGKSIPGQHDGPDDTVDSYGKPNGWCWSCWKDHKLTTLQSQLTQAVRERDDAIREANRRDQKWMDGINETLGQKLDYGDPCSRDNASKALGQFARQLTQAHKERDEAMASAAVMRAAMKKFVDASRDPLKWSFSIQATATLMFDEVLSSTSAGKAFLERMKEAEWLLGNISFQPRDCEWMTRRDAWLKGGGK